MHNHSSARRAAPGAAKSQTSLLRPPRASSAGRRTGSGTLRGGAIAPSSLPHHLAGPCLCPRPRPVWKSKFHGAFVLNRRVVLHAIDATPARWRGDASSSPLDRASTAASSPRNDLVDFHTGCPKRSTSAFLKFVDLWRAKKVCTRR